MSVQFASSTAFASEHESDTNIKVREAESGSVLCWSLR
jgi:hypothetical protein